MLSFVLLGCSCFAPAFGEEEVEVLLRTSSSWDGVDLESYGEGTPEITILRVVIPPGYQVSTHKHPTINAAVLLSGQLTLYAEDGNELIVNAGQAVVEVIEKWHNGRTTSEESAVLLVFYAGVEGQPLTVMQ